MYIFEGIKISFAISLGNISSNQTCFARSVINAIIKLASLVSYFLYCHTIPQLTDLKQKGKALQILHDYVYTQRCVRRLWRRPL